MTQFVRNFRGPDYRENDPDPDLAPMLNECMVARGVHYCAVQKYELGTSITTGLLYLFYQNGAKGLVLRQTPAGARELAASLIRYADELDAHASEKAATLAKKGQPE